jgi:translation initiation factor IF-1
MVKNTKGGKGAKSMARKNTKATVSVPMPSSPSELLAVVSKVFGPTCQVLLSDGTTLLCHIRGKFHKRKSGNRFSVGSIVMVGLWEWESESSRNNCDLMFVYDATQILSIADSVVLPSLPSAFMSSATDIVFDSAPSSDIMHSNDDLISDSPSLCDSFHDL